MEKNTDVYSCSNVEAMVNSVKANTEIIESMLTYTRKNDKEINGKLSSYALSKKNIGNDSIDMYREYINQKQSIEDALNEYSKKINADSTLHQMTIELHNIDSDYSALHKIFEEINKIQVKVMEMLCTLMGKANSLLSCL